MRRALDSLPMVVLVLVLCLMAAKWINRVVPAPQ